MPPLDWNGFAELPGAPESNFEGLCRVLIHRHYGQYGDFGGLAQQPGIEFHLRLGTQCPLGEPGRWYGWQCRWYDLPRGRQIGTKRRNGIQAAIVKTTEVLPDLTDWVLWTRYPLTKGDQEWFKGLVDKLQLQMQLHLWDTNEVEEHLSGSAEIFRRTYFGDLVLTIDDLAGLHEQATAQVRGRWQPELHQTIEAERSIQKMLGHPDAWSELRDLAECLKVGYTAVESELDSISVSLRDHAAEMVGLAQCFELALEGVYSALLNGDLDSLNELLLDTPSGPQGSSLVLSRKLRNKRHQTALVVTNLLADIQSASEVLKAVCIDLGARQSAVVADYGRGKTHLAAQLTAPDGNRPAGILLYGRDLSAVGTLNQLAGTVVIQATQVGTMEALVAAVDAAGRRAHRRLPIFIDGLNEAEDPRVWKGLLASLDETLKRYPYVLVVTTVRPEFSDEALPEATGKLEMPNFGGDATDAINRYFEHYLIDATDAALPWDLLEHPLILLIFCEVTNPKREHTLRVETMPWSLTGLFERYLQNSAERIAELSPLTHRYYEHDVRSAFDEIGVALWEGKSRSLSMPELQERLGDSSRPWDQSLVRALEEDGVLHRVRGDTPNQGHVGVINDALAGHLVAQAILAKYGSAGLEDWLKNADTLKALTGPVSDQHPLASDSRRAFVGLVPRKCYGKHFWTFLDEPLRTVALRDAADLEGTYIDAQTVEELFELVTRPPGEPRSLFARLLYTRSTTSHPLNAEFLDSVLRPLGVAERDIRWTEWIRRNDENILADLRKWVITWRDEEQRDQSDRLRAQWIKWVLTSTVKSVRDEATQALYWYGRGAPRDLFELTVDSLSINDPYVYERLLAASYGVAMANQNLCPDLAKALGNYLQGLADNLVGPSATHPTNDLLVRLYVQDTADFASCFCPDAVPDILKAPEDGHPISFAAAPTVSSIDQDNASLSEVDRTLHMHFENYTLGRLFEHRQNYDMEHPGHKEAVAYVLGAVWDLGWREDIMGEVDRSIDEQSPRFGRAGSTERYGKKYGWIGFRTYAGMIEEGMGRFGRELFDDYYIDPSFPGRLIKSPIHLPDWARATPVNLQRWIRKGKVNIPDQFLNPGEVGEEQGPWVAIYGYLVDKKEELGREVFGFITALLVEPNQVDELMGALAQWNHLSEARVPSAPNDHLTFAGEIPWSQRFARDETEGPLYIHKMSTEGQSTIEVEILFHCYSWEGFATGALSNVPVPSKSFSAAFGLRGAPQTFSQELSDGVAVSKTLGAPGEFSGYVLYLREDLVLEYARGRQLVWFVWGERQLCPFPIVIPDWLVKARIDQADVWQYVRQHHSLS